MTADPYMHILARRDADGVVSHDRPLIQHRPGSEDAVAELAAMDERLRDEAAEAVTNIIAAPHTGEALALRNLSDEQLAQVLDEAAEWERARWRTFRRDLQDEALRRMDAVACWTLHTEGGWKLEGDSPARTEIGVSALREALTTAGASAEQLARAIKPPKPAPDVVDRRGVNALRKLPHLADAIERVEVPSSKPRQVRVTRGLR